MKAVWYYQTKDFKFHTLRKVKRIEEIADSEKKMKIFFDDKICLGCQLKKDFIEILFGEKQVRVNIKGIIGSAFGVVLIKEHFRKQREIVKCCGCSLGTGGKKYE